MFQFNHNSGVYPFEFVLKYVGIGDAQWKLGWQRLDAAVRWSREQFGSANDGNWYCEDGIMAIYFKRSEDAFAFRMRWC